MANAARRRMMASRAPAFVYDDENIADHRFADDKVTTPFRRG